MDNYRILIVDDLGSMHEDFSNILIPAKNPSAEQLGQIASLLFDDSKDNQLPPFVLKSAFQGEEAIELVRKSMEEEQPYALAFVDILMPPGLDGIETIRRMWELDNDIQIVICTAYAKYTWEDIRRKLGFKDSLFILKKPFDRMEVLQLACALTKKWSNHQFLTNPIDDQKMSLGNFDIDNTIATIKSNMDDLEDLLKKF